MKLAAAALAAALTLLAVAPAASEGTQPVKAEDLFALALIDDAQISPDGKNVAFVVERLDGARNRNRSAIWLVPADASSAPRQITQGERDESPRWSPDRHTLAFVRRAAGKPQIYALDLAAGGEAHALTTAKDGANEPEWSHDGKRILYQGIERDKPVPTHVDWHAAGITAPAKHEHTDIRTISTLRFETNGLGYTYDRRAHLWVMNADGTQKRRLTSGPYSARNAHWSPDDATIAYNAYLAPPSPVFKTDLYTIAAQGGTPVKVPLGHLRQIFGAWSHDGARLWFQTSSTHDGAALPGVASVRRDGSDERQVVAENEVAFRDAVLADMKEDGRGCGPLLDPLDRWFVADVSVPGGTALARFDATTGKQTVLAGGDREIAECSMSEDGAKIAYVATDATHPGEVYVLDVAGGASTKVSGLNDSYVASHALSGIERHTVKNSSGQPIEYWVMRPPQASPGKRYPTIVDIHGGPQYEFGNSFFHEFQFWASRGYVVAFGNPRGSVGYGYQWSRDLEGNWGDPMFDDVMAITNEVAGRADVDPQRLVVSGGSYGGYATLWIVGHTQRFKAAIAERVVSNLFTQLLGSDYGGSAPGQYSWGEPWTHRDVLWKQSPVAYVKNVRTPLLILHSDNDTRTPVDQTYEEFMALKSLARPVWLLEVPRDTHDLSRVGEPIHRVERLNLLADWLGKHV